MKIQLLLDFWKAGSATQKLYSSPALAEVVLTSSISDAVHGTGRYWNETVLGTQGSGAAYGNELMLIPYSCPRPHMLHEAKSVAQKRNHVDSIYS